MPSHLLCQLSWLQIFYLFIFYTAVPLAGKFSSGEGWYVCDLSFHPLSQHKGKMRVFKKAKLLTAKSFFFFFKYNFLVCWSCCNSNGMGSSLIFLYCFTVWKFLLQ